LDSVSSSPATVVKAPQDHFVLSEDTSEDAEDSASRDDKMPLVELMTSWFNTQNLGSINGLDVDAIVEQENDSDNTVPNYREFDSEALEWLLARLRVELRVSPTEPNAKENIRKEIMSLLRPDRPISRGRPSQQFEVEFDLACNLGGLVAQQGYERPASEILPQIVTLTGSEQDVQALTIAEYLNQTWPNTGSQVLRLVQNAFGPTVVDNTSKSSVRVPEKS
jgi:hypothetical protein